MVLRPKKPRLKLSTGILEQGAGRARRRRDVQQTLRDIRMYMAPAMIWRQSFNLNIDP